MHFQKKKIKLKIIGIDMRHDRCFVETNNLAILELHFNLNIYLRHCSRSKRIDVISRITFPLVFALFNLVYWSTYLFREEEEN